MNPIAPELIAQAPTIAWAFFFGASCIILTLGLAQWAGLAAQHALRLWAFKARGLRTPTRWRWHQKMRCWSGLSYPRTSERTFASTEPTDLYDTETGT